MSALATFQSSTDHVVSQGFSGSISFGILSTFPPTPCGLATFSAALARGLIAHGDHVCVVQVSDGSPSSSARVIGELVNGSAASVAACSDLLNRSDIAVIQHDYEIYGGIDGDEVIGIMDGLRVPSIVIAHTVLKNPSRHQRSVFEAVAARADKLVVMSDVANERLCRGFDIDRRKVSTIPHGATVPTDSCVRGGRPTLLTWGLLRPGMGVERVIEAMGSLSRLPGRPRYVVAGQTHPKVLAAEGEAYRDALLEQARSSGVLDSVRFDSGYRNVATLTALVQSAAVVVVPYDSTDQVVSGVLVDAVACGRPVVATAFPHAVELLSNGAGIVVAHDDLDALVSALTRVLTEPRLAGSMAAEARRLASEMSWPVIAGAYQALARRVLAPRQARV
ncbi:glycosyl transferase family 1 [Mycobacterium florentinum]|uniref:Glycosyl transferase family 1 n=1 Tax=Mycobacterium florentinum TaxID=292462 RepID=A0A1X1TWX4_MYCFL|nr:glycosyl transferase family 1 [Mycobacterium florentinum]